MHILGSKPLHFLLIVLAFTSIHSVVGLFEDPGDIVLLNSMIDFQSVLFNSDFLVSVLICHDDVENCRLIQPVYKEFASNMKDFVKSFAIVCDSTPEKMEIPYCAEENREVLPYLAYFEPPLTLINPYTKQVSKPSEHRYAGEGNPKALADFARKHMPAFRETITNQAQLEKFLAIKEIPNKVLLFTNKPQTSPLYKGLASEYRNRLLFGEINESAKDLVAEYGITKYPTLLVVKQNEDGTSEREFYEYDLAIEKLRRFLKTYALQEKANYVHESAASSQEQAHQQEQQQQYQQQQTQQPPKEEKIKATVVTAQNFETEVNKHERVVLAQVFTDSQYPILEQVIEKYGRFFEYIDLDCNDAENEKYARETLGVKSFPALIAFPVGTPKKMGLRVQFGKTKTLQDITEEVSDLVGDKVIPITSGEMQGAITNALVKRQPAFILMYDTNEISVTYRLLSQLSKYENKLTFAKLKNPAPEVVKHFELTKLPALLSVLYETNDDDEVELDPSKVRMVKYSGRFIYEDMSRYFDMFLPQDEQLQNMKINKKVNEITSQEDLLKYCPRDSRVCVIGLLNGYRGTEAAQANLEDKVATLTHVLKKHPHLPFTWVDATCHSELLISLNIQSEDVPTVIVYSPVMKEFAQLVGTFDNSSISVFLDKVLKRKLPMNGVRDGIVLETKNCEEVHEVLKKLESGSGASADDDFMKEYLEELRKKEEEDTTGKKKRKKKKKYDDEL